MNSLEIIKNSIVQNINESTIDTLVSVGFDHDDAVKTVMELEMDEDLSVSDIDF